MNNVHPFNQINFTKTNAWVIEASAGTGKTWTIERLYIKALLQNIEYSQYKNLSIQNILVVTFTKDATRELKTRIRLQIKNTINTIINIIININNNKPITVYHDIYHEFLVKRYIESKCDYKKDILFLNICLQNFDNASIYTIHSFCSQILKRYPFDCSVNPDYNLITDNKSLIENLVKKFILSIFSNTKYLTHVKQIEFNILKLFESNNKFNTTHYTPDSILKRVLKCIPNDVIVYKDGKYQIKYPYESQNVDNLMLDLISEIQDDNQLIVIKMKFIYACFDYIIVHYSANLSYLNKLTNDDLIQIVADNITKDNLSQKIYEEYPIAFIDEFQDTDQLQWLIFNQIYNFKKRGNLIVVGDPKQAIYKFRGADINTYITARNQINQVCQLIDNYRSDISIMEFINQLFKLKNQNSTLANSFLGYEIDYVKINAKGQPNLKLPTVDQINEQLKQNNIAINRKYYNENVQIIAVTGDNKTSLNTTLLNHMVSEIMGLLTVDPSLISKIAILTANNKQIGEIIQYVKKFNLRIAEPKLGSIYATSTATDVYNILSAINDLTDKRKLVKAIASKIFNLPLYELKLENGVNEMAETWFVKYHEIWKKNGIIELFYSILDDICNYHNSTNGVINNRELANFWQLAELINRENKLNNNELLYWLKNKIADRLNNTFDINENAEEVVRLDNDGEYIIITTIHKSKGLEYDVLFCPYFKNSLITIKETPIFTTLHSHPTIITKKDDDAAKTFICEENQEIQRLNYVALTRAKSRIYIYIKEIKKNKSGSYYKNSSIESISYLFGLNIDNPNDTSHPIANYEDIFNNQSIKSGSPLSKINGVIVYSIDELAIDDYKNLKPQYNVNQDDYHHIDTKAIDINYNQLYESYYKQSYSELTQEITHELPEFLINKDIDNVESISYVNTEYKYSILSNSLLKGAEFGVLFHTLCEEYPLNHNKLKHILSGYSVIQNHDDIANELINMTNDVFNYSLFNNISLNMLPNKISELEFNLTINQQVNIKVELSQLISQHYGAEHSFSKYIKMLDKINHGFLVGFIDVVFEYSNKYYVLDYKTNILDDYTYTNNYNQKTLILESMASHHYYLQYLLYLVAVKRYLEYRLKINDATHLIGGAIYYYVRGALTVQSIPFAGIYMDDHCQSLVSKIDKLFKGEAI